jgi:hypothetical protein
VVPETDGQPSPPNPADPDEDGVTFLSPFVANGTAAVKVNVQNASAGGAKLDAWIDWNHNGSWNDPGEEIAVDTTVFNGDNTLIINVPAAAMVSSATPTYARFRLSTAGGLAPTGAAADGEVEDYQITLSPCPSTVYVDPAYTGTPGTMVNGHTVGFDAFATIQQGVNVVCPAGTVVIYGGTYAAPATLDINKSLSAIDVSTNPLDAPAVATVTINEAVTLTDGVTFQGLGVGTNAAAANLTFGSTVDSGATAQSLTVTEPAANTVAFNAAVGQASPLNVLTISDPATATVNAVQASAVSITATTINVDGVVNTSGGSPGTVTLTAGQTINLTGGGIKVGTGNVMLTSDLIDLGAPGSISSTSTSGTSHLLFQPLTASRNIVLGGTTDVANALTFTTTDAAAIKQGGANHGFGLITIGAAKGTGAVRMAGALTGISTNVTLYGSSLALGYGLGTTAAYALTLRIGGAVTTAGGGYGTLYGKVALHAGNLTTALGLTLHVVGSIALNNTPLVITGPTSYPLATVFTIVSATTQVSGAFAGFPNNTYVVLGSTRYYSRYSTTTMTLTSGGAAVGPRFGH